MRNVCTGQSIIIFTSPSPAAKHNHSAPDKRPANLSFNLNQRD